MTSLLARSSLQNRGLWEWCGRQVFRGPSHVAYDWLSASSSHLCSRQRSWLISIFGAACLDLCTVIKGLQLAENSWVLMCRTMLRWTSVICPPRCQKLGFWGLCVVSRITNSHLGSELIALHDKDTADGSTVLLLNSLCESAMSRSNPWDAHKEKNDSFSWRRLSAEKCLLFVCSDSRDPSSAAWA